MVLLCRCAAVNVKVGVAVYADVHGIVTVVNVDVNVDAAVHVNAAVDVNPIVNAQVHLDLNGHAAINVDVNGDGTGMLMQL